MATKRPVNLQKTFSTVTQVLKENQSSLNQADEFNHNHGDNIVDTFETITRAMAVKRNATPAQKLEYASQLLKDKPSGSAKVYSQNLANAAGRFRGKRVTQDNALDLVTAVLGAGTHAQTQASPQQGDALSSLLGGLMSSGAATSQAQSAPQGDMLGSLLGGLMGGGGTQSQPQSAPQGDMLSSLLGGIMGGGTAQPASAGAQSESGLDMGDLLQAGMAFMQAKQQGQSTGQALVSAVLQASPLSGNTPREQSGSLIASTLMQVLGGLGK